MDPIDAYLTAVIASCLIPALYLIFAARGRFWRAVTLWLAWPVLVYFVIIFKETAAAPPGTYPLSDALLGISLLSAFLILPWLVISSVVIGMALVLRRWFRPSAGALIIPSMAPRGVDRHVVTRRFFPNKANRRSVLIVLANAAAALAIIASISRQTADPVAKPVPVIAVPEGGFRPS